MEHLPPYFSGSSLFSKEHRLAWVDNAPAAQSADVPNTEKPTEAPKGLDKNEAPRIEPGEEPEPGARRAAAAELDITAHVTDREKAKVAGAAALNAEPTSREDALRQLQTVNDNRAAQGRPVRDVGGGVAAGKSNEPTRPAGREEPPADPVERAAWAKVRAQQRAEDQRLEAARKQREPMAAVAPQAPAAGPAQGPANGPDEGKLDLIKNPKTNLDVLMNKITEVGARSGKAQEMMQDKDPKIAAQGKMEYFKAIIEGLALIIEIIKRLYDGTLFKAPDGVPGGDKEPTPEAKATQSAMDDVKGKLRGSPTHTPAEIRDAARATSGETQAALDQNAVDSKAVGTKIEAKERRKDELPGKIQMAEAEHKKLQEAKALPAEIKKATDAIAALTAEQAALPNDLQSLKQEQENLKTDGEALQRKKEAADRLAKDMDEADGLFKKGVKALEGRFGDRKIDASFDVKGGQVVLQPADQRDAPELAKLVGGTLVNDGKAVRGDYDQITTKLKELESQPAAAPVKPGPQVGRMETAPVGAPAAAQAAPAEKPVVPAQAPAPAEAVPQPVRAPEGQVAAAPKEAMDKAREAMGKIGSAIDTIRILAAHPQVDREAKQISAALKRITLLPGPDGNLVIQSDAQTIGDAQKALPVLVGSDSGWKINTNGRIQDPEAFLTSLTAIAAKLEQGAGLKDTESLTKEFTSKGVDARVAKQAALLQQRFNLPLLTENGSVWTLDNGKNTEATLSWVGSALSPDMPIDRNIQLGLNAYLSDQLIEGSPSRPAALKQILTLQGGDWADSETQKVYLALASAVPEMANGIGFSIDNKSVVFPSLNEATREKIMQSVTNNNITLPPVLQKYIEQGPLT